MKTDILPIFETPHAPLASYLLTKFVPLSSIRIDGNRGTFVFQQVPRQLVIDFNEGTALVEPNLFAGKMSGLINQARVALEGKVHE